MKLLTRSKDQLRLGMNCPFKHRQEHLRVFRQALKYAGLGVRSSNILLPQYETDLVASTAQLKESRHVSAKDELEWNKSSRET